MKNPRHLLVTLHFRFAISNASPRRECSCNRAFLLYKRIGAPEKAFHAFFDLLVINFENDDPASRELSFAA